MGRLDDVNASGLGWRQVFDACPIPVSVVTPDGVQVYGNPAYARFLGYSIDELGTLDVRALTHSDDRVWTEVYLRRLADGEVETYSTVKSYVRKDGTSVTGMLTSQALFVEDACVALVGTIHPMDRVAPMADTRLQKYIENVSDTIALVDANGHVLENSGRYKRLLGYPSEFWEERSIFELVPDDDRAEVERLRMQIFSHPGQVVTSEFRLRTAAGTLATMAVSVVNLLDDPDIGALVVTAREITALRHLIEELSRSRDEAMAEAELRSRVVATVSHELRNPLHAVLGLSELLARGDAADPDEMAGVLNRQLVDLARIVDDLLAATRLEAGGVTLLREPVDLRTLVADIVEVYAKAAEDGVLVAGHVAEHVPDRVDTDPVRLRQIIANLLGNAVKFTSAGRVDVDVDYAITAGETRIVVRDTGPGIPPEELHRVFEPYVAGEGRGAGSGLGLSIVRRIVDALGGELVVDSEVGVGTAFVLTVPMREVAAPTMTPVLTPVAAPLRVLVVEDNEVNRQLAIAQLKLLGHDCTVAGTGAEGLALLTSPAAERFDAVLMDFHLPDMHGVEVARKVAEWERSNGVPHTRVIGFTASTGPRDARRLLEDGMDDRLAKPVRLSDLERVLATRPARADRRGAATVPARGDDLLDVAVLEELVTEMGDRAVVAGVVTTYLGELERRTEGIIAAAANGDTHRRSLLVHTLASSSRLVGAGALAAIAERFPDRACAADVRAAAAGVAGSLERWLKA